MQLYKSIERVYQDISSGHGTKILRDLKSTVNNCVEK